VPVAVHLVVDPVAVEVLPVRPGVLAAALNFIHAEFAFVDRSIRESEFALPVLLALKVVTLVERTIWPSLSSEAILFIVFPGSYVACSIRMNVSSLTIGLIIDPITFIDVTVRVVQFSITICLVINPLAVVERVIGPALLSVSITLIAKPFTFVDGIRFQRLRSSHDSLQIFELLTTRCILVVSLGSAAVSILDKLLLVIC